MTAAHAARLSAKDWTEIAIRMQRRANVAGLFGRTREVRSYCRRRDFCMRMAARSGLADWGPVSEEAGRIIA